MFIPKNGRRGGTTMSAAIGALDAVFDPAAARARESLRADHERTVATPSPGDRMLTEGRITLSLPPSTGVSDAT